MDFVRGTGFSGSTTFRFCRFAWSMCCMSSFDHFLFVIKCSFWECVFNKCIDLLATSLFFIVKLLDLKFSFLRKYAFPYVLNFVHMGPHASIPAKSIGWVPSCKRMLKTNMGLHIIAIRPISFLDYAIAF